MSKQFSATTALEATCIKQVALLLKDEKLWTTDAEIRQCLAQVPFTVLLHICAQVRRRTTEVALFRMILAWYHEQQQTAAQARCAEQLHIMIRLQNVPPAVLCEMYDKTCGSGKAFGAAWKSALLDAFYRQSKQKRSCMCK